MKKLGIGFVLLFGVGCTDARMSKLLQLGSPQHIKCYSGGAVIYEGDSTGKVANENDSDGYYWEDAATQKIVEVSADCVFVAK